MQYRILVCYGTRPEQIKLEPFISLLQKEEKVELDVFQVQQQKDIIKEGVAIESGSNRLDDIVISILKQFPDREYDYIVVQGDTTTAFACALSAFHRKIKIIYLESGLRSGNLLSPYPEEFNRITISKLAHIHFCINEDSRLNLLKEGITENIHVVGSTSLDTIHSSKSSFTTSIVLCTFHRRENLDLLKVWFRELDFLALAHPYWEFILPCHMNPFIQDLAKKLENVTVIDPVSRKKFIDLLEASEVVITDSGGVQEEAVYLNKPVIVCRQYTERKDPAHIQCKIPSALIASFDKALNANLCPESRFYYGDGKASERIINELNNYYLL